MTEQRPRPCDDPVFRQRLASAPRIWLFLDYDGTLAEFAPSPDHVLPDPAVAQLLAELVADPRLRVAVVSGRRLDQIQALAPVPGLLLAGSYGLEMQTPAGGIVHRVDHGAIRPALERIKPQWAALLAGREGYFLEDKDWTLAVHASKARDGQEEAVLAAARAALDSALQAVDPNLFRILGGYKFLEIGPRLAHKGLTIEYLLAEFAWPDALPLYVGDDDKDEEAFSVIQAHGGLAVVVAAEARETLADCRLESPQAVHRWLSQLPAMLAA